MLEEAQAKKIEPGLALIEADELSRSIVENLPAELGTNRAGGTGNQHASSGQLAAHRLQVDLHAFAAEQVIEADIAQLADHHLPGDDVLEGGHSAETNSRAIAGFNESAHLRAGSGRHSYECFLS